jgi:hypothetical protein
MQMDLCCVGKQKYKCYIVWRDLGASAARGCPQGGVLSPLLWSLVVDDLISGLNSNGKYFGLTLDKGLTWKKQLDTAINNAYKVFWTCRGTFGKTWGLKPKVVYWIYTVVRPSYLCCHHMMAHS